MSQDRVLSKAVIGQQTLLNTAGLILGGSLFVALAAAGQRADVPGADDLANAGDPDCRADLWRTVGGR